MIEASEIGLFCGTFNPIHWGHLLLAECAREQFALAQVYFVTSARPPHRNDHLLAAYDRHAMVCQAIADNDFFRSSDLEINRPGPSYTIDTIKYFHNTLGPNVRISLLIGQDNVQYLPSWHHIDEIFKLSRLLIAPRSQIGNNVQIVNSLEEGCTINYLSEEEKSILAGSNYAIINFPAVNTSSTNIRQRVAAGKSILYMVPMAVNQLITQKGYYQ